MQPAIAAAVRTPEEAPIYEAIDRVRLVFVDGVFAPEKSDAFDLAGVEITPLAEVLRTDIHWARDLFGTLEANGQVPVERPLAALSTARPLPRSPAASGRRRGRGGSGGAPSRRRRRRSARRRS